MTCHWLWGRLEALLVQSFVLDAGWTGWLAPLWTLLLDRGRGLLDGVVSFGLLLALFALPSFPLSLLLFTAFLTLLPFLFFGRFLWFFNPDLSLLICFFSFVLNFYFSNRLLRFLVLLLGHRVLGLLANTTRSCCYSRCRLTNCRLFDHRFKSPGGLSFGLKDRGRLFGQVNKGPCRPSGLNDGRFLRPQ